MKKEKKRKSIETYKNTERSKKVYQIFMIIFCFLVIGIVLNQVYLNKDTIVQVFQEKKTEFVETKQDEIEKDLKKKTTKEKQKEYMEEENDTINKQLGVKQNKNNTKAKDKKKSKKQTDSENLLTKQSSYNDFDFSVLGTIFKWGGIILLIFGFLKNLLKKDTKETFSSFAAIITGVIMLLISFFLC